MSYPLPPYAVAVAATPSSVSATQNRPGTALFKIKNTGSTAGTLNLSESCSAQLTCQSPNPTSVFLNPGDSSTATANFTAGSTVATGTLTLTALYSGQSVSGSGTVSVSIQPPPVTLAVTPDNSPRTVGAGQPTVDFFVANTSNFPVTVSLTGNCGVFAPCSVLVNGQLLVANEVSLDAATTLPPKSNSA